MEISYHTELSGFHLTVKLSSPANACPLNVVCPNANVFSARHTNTQSMMSMCSYMILALLRIGILQPARNKAIKRAHVPLPLVLRPLRQLQGMGPASSSLTYTISRGLRCQKHSILAAIQTGLPTLTGGRLVSTQPNDMWLHDFTASRAVRNASLPSPICVHQTVRVSCWITGKKQRRKGRRGSASLATCHLCRIEVLYPAIHDTCAARNGEWWFEALCGPHEKVVGSIPARNPLSVVPPTESLLTRSTIAVAEPH